MPMPVCCLQSFAWKGIEEKFALAKPGDTHTCRDCGQKYRLLLRAPEGRFIWTEVVEPLEIPKNDCAVYRPDHNGECLNCDEWADMHTTEAIEAGTRLLHEKK